MIIMLTQQKAVRDVPTFRQMGKRRDRRQPIRFVMTIDGAEKQVEVIALHARHVVGGEHGWSGVVRPVEPEGASAFSVTVTTDDDTGTGTYI